MNEDSSSGGRNPSSIKPPTIKPPTVQADTFGSTSMGSAPTAPSAPFYASAPPPPQAAVPPPPSGPLARLTSTRVQGGVLWVIIGLSLLIAGLLVLLLALVLYMRLM